MLAELSFPCRRNGAPNADFNGDGVLKKNGEKEMKVSGLCGLQKLFKWRAVNPKREMLLIVNNKQLEAEEDEISRLKMEKNNEAEKWKDLWLKQREEIKSLQNPAILDSSMISTYQLQDLLDEFAFLKGRLQSLADDVAELKAEKYSGKGDYTHFSSPPMTTLYDRGDYSKPRFYEDDYTSCHYTNSI